MRPTGFVRGWLLFLAADAVARPLDRLDRRFVDGESDTSHELHTRMDVDPIIGDLTRAFETSAGNAAKKPPTRFPPPSEIQPTTPPPPDGRRAASDVLSEAHAGEGVEPRRGYYGPIPYPPEKPRGTVSLPMAILGALAGIGLVSAVIPAWYGAFHIPASEWRRRHEEYLAAARAAAEAAAANSSPKPPIDNHPTAGSPTPNANVSGPVTKPPPPNPSGDVPPGPTKTPPVNDKAAHEAEEAEKKEHERQQAERERQQRHEAEKQAEQRHEAEKEERERERQEREERERMEKEKKKHPIEEGGEMGDGPDNLSPAKAW